MFRTVALLTPSGIQGGLVHIANHAFSKITLFFCAGAICVATHKKSISEMNGLGRVMPFTFGAFVVVHVMVPPDSPQLQPVPVAETKLSPDGRTSVSPFENPALASAGTGDVLAGTIGALLAQGLDTFEAAQLGVYLHAMAGEAVRTRLGDAGLLASDLTPELPLARKAPAPIRHVGE